jgi:hypothetical protein
MFTERASRRSNKRGAPATYCRGADSAPPIRQPGDGVKRFPRMGFQDICSVVTGRDARFTASRFSRKAGSHLVQPTHNK